METPAMSPDVVNGQVSMPEAPQVPAPETQVPAQGQETASTQVERSELNASSQEDARKASDFETARQIKRLEKTMRSLQQAFERSQQSSAPQASPQTSVPQFTNEELVKDPLKVIKAIAESVARNEVQGVKSEIPQQLQQFSEANRYESARQESLRLIKTNESVKSDPQGFDRIAEILNEEDDDGFSLEKLSQTNPKVAAKLALQEYQSRYGTKTRSASAPTKAQMQTTATAVNAAAPQGNTDQEAAQLYRMVLNDPNLMNDPAFKTRLDAFNQKQRLKAAAGIR